VLNCGIELYQIKAAPLIRRRRPSLRLGRDARRAAHRGVLIMKTHPAKWGIQIRYAFFAPIVRPVATTPGMPYRSSHAISDPTWHGSYSMGTLRPTRMKGVQ
jgi:hypothetical protein